MATSQKNTNCESNNQTVTTGHCNSTPSGIIDINNCKLEDLLVVVDNISFMIIRNVV